MKDSEQYIDVDVGSKTISCSLQSVSSEMDSSGEFYSAKMGIAGKYTNKHG